MRDALPPPTSARSDRQIPAARVLFCRFSTLSSPHLGMEPSETPSVVHLAPETGGKCTTDEYEFGSTVDPWRQGFSNRKLLENFTDVFRSVVGSRGWGRSDREDFRRGVYFCRFSTLGPERQNTSPPAGICSQLFSRRPDKRQDKFRPAGKNPAAFEDRYFS